MTSRAHRALHARWLGTVPYREALPLQRALHERSGRDHLLMLEHPHVYTLGSRATPEHVLVPPADVGAELVRADRGGDVTYHGPGQLVGYPIVTLPPWRAGQRDVVGYVRAIENALVAALGELGIDADRDERYPGVWVGDEKIAAIGVRVARGRTRHGFALNVHPDLEMFDHIVPCGIRDRGVTSMRRLMGSAAPTIARVVDVVVDHLAQCLGYDDVERQDIVWRHHPADLSAFSRGATARTDAAITPSRGGWASAPRAPGAPTHEGSRESAAQPVRLLGRLAEAGVKDSIDVAERRPDWLRVTARLGTEFTEMKRLMRGLGLATVCEEAGCPNIYECWADRTATFMILGERCTRACGFCLVDTRRPLPVDPDEPRRVAEAVRVLGLEHAVVTCVARDDLPDGGAAAFAATIAAIREVSASTRVEVLISDCKGDDASLRMVFDARPDILNHNLETVARLQRAARPSAGYARSLSVLAQAKESGLTTKSGIIVGMGETFEEVAGTMIDLSGVGVDILTIGQYLRPSTRHLPVSRWWTPEQFDELAALGHGLGFAHVEAGPLVRSSYHAQRGADAADSVGGPARHVVDASA